jgi:hypothetical protein
MIDFAAALNEALNAAIDKKLEPLLQRRNALKHWKPTVSITSFALPRTTKSS